MQMNKTNPILRIFILLQLLNENESDWMFSSLTFLLKQSTDLKRRISESLIII
jgi:hypothetical protein